MPPKQYVKIFDIYVCNQLHLPWLKCVCQQVVCCCGLHNFEGCKPLSAGTVSIVLEMGAQSHCRCENRKKADSDGKLVCSMSCCKDSRQWQYKSYKCTTLKNWGTVVKIVIGCDVPTFSHILM